MYEATRAKKARAVARVVDRPEDGGRGDGGGRRVRVELADVDGDIRAEPPPRRGDHRRLDVDAPVPETAREQVLAESPVTAGEIEHLVARVERDPERRDERGSVVEIGAGVGVLGVRPPLGLARVLIGLAHSRASVSGWRRT